MPRFVYISKTDEDNSDYNATFDALRERFGKNIAPVVVPIWDENKKVTVTFYQVINGKSYEKETVAQTVGAGADHSTTSTVAINETGDYYAVIKVVDGTKVVAETATATVSFSK